MSNMSTEQSTTSAVSPDQLAAIQSLLSGIAAGSGQTVNASSRVYVGNASAPVPGSNASIAQYKTVDQVKKSFGSLSPADKKILANKVVELGYKPTDKSLRSFWNVIVSETATQNAAGSLITPLDYAATYTVPLGTQAYGTAAPSVPQKTIYAIDANGAKALLEKQALAAGMPAKFSKEDINAFVNEYNTQGKLQAQKSSTKMVGGTNVNTYQPSTFSPNDIADKWLWARTDMGDPKLAGQALLALQNVQAIVKGNGLDHVSDVEIKNLAKQVASGTLNINDVKTQMGQQAAMQYPQFAERFAKNPNATVADFAQPYISKMANTLELDPATISLSDPLLDKALRPDGTAGKVASMSLPDFNMALMNDKRWESTTAANNAARDAATGLLRAFGYGV